MYVPEELKGVARFTSQYREKSLKSFNILLSRKTVDARLILFYFVYKANVIFQFLVDNDILFKHQFGFLPGHSTSNALINLVNKVANAVDCQKYLAGIFLDISKAFDTLDHAILLSKLEACGITGTAHQWITDYFRNRMQYVQIDDSKSDALRQICGVPQGSILGPLFLSFISMISRPVLALMNSNLYYLLMTPV